MYTWIAYFRTLFNRNRDVQCAVIGPTGTGKTLSAICIALMTMYEWTEDNITNPTPEMLQQMRDFVDNNILFEAQELFKIVKNKYRKGTCFVVEEIGVSMDNTQFHTKIARHLKYVLQTIRHRCYGIFYTVPILNSSQKQSRALMPIIIRTAWVDNAEKKCYVIPRLFPVNPITGDLLSDDGYLLGEKRRGRIRSWGIPMLPKEIIERYEERKTKFTTALYEQMVLDEDGAPKITPTHVCTRPECRYAWKAMKEGVKSCPRCGCPTAISLNYDKTRTAAV